eukprot:3439412-Amphidinium_carterae.1
MQTGMRTRLSHQAANAASRKEREADDEMRHAVHSSFMCDVCAGRALIIRLQEHISRLQMVFLSGFLFASFIGLDLPSWGFHGASFIGLDLPSWGFHGDSQHQPSVSVSCEMQLEVLFLQMTP